MRGWVGVFGLIVMLVTTHTQAQLQPFSATYSASLDLLIDIPVEAVRKLERIDETSWRFTSIARAAIARQEERSDLSYSSDAWVPSYYQYQRSVFGRVREISVNFQPERNRIMTVARNEPWSQAYEEGVQDKLSYQLQLREDLLAGKSMLSYRIADGGRIKTYRFTRAGNERLTTPAGTFDCIRLQLERTADQQQTLIWMAPELEYLTVRLLRIDESGREHFLNLKSLETN